MGWELEPASPVGREGAHAPSGNWVDLPGALAADHDAWIVPLG